MDGRRRDAQPSLFSGVTLAEAVLPERVVTVGQLGRMLKNELERATSALCVEGEVTGLREVQSGHVYFALRDEKEEAAIDCVMYRAAPVRARKLLADGARLVLGGKVTFWAPRGRAQMIVETARPAGRGALLEALEKRRAALAAEGLFAAERKRPLPKEPRVIGLVTSDQGAAYHDILKVAFQRGRVRFVFAPAAVQGVGAAEALARALRKLCKHPEVEAIILGRGGGSAEDLAAFNDEVLVRAIAACTVPVVSAVGHETDLMLADLAADVRASTPSQAAELLVPDARARLQLIGQLGSRLVRAMRRQVDERHQRVDVASSELSSLARRALARRLDEVSRLERRLAARHPAARLSAARAAVSPLEQRLARAGRLLVSERMDALLPLERRLAEVVRLRVAREQRELAEACARLDALSPLAVLGRGYAIVRSRTTGSIVLRAAQVATGEPITVRLGEGTIDALVTDRRDGQVEPDHG